METFIILALILIIALLLNMRSTQKETAERTHKSFLSLKKELLELKKQNEAVEVSKKDSPLKATDEEVVQWRPYKAPEHIEKMIGPEIKPGEEKIIIPEQVEKIIEPATEKIMTPEPAVPVQNPEIPSEGLWEKWMRNNPDLEKFIGENLINKIGIAVLVLGIAFFVKYAIDQNWIDETARACIGIACGIILVGIAHRLRNSYRSFSSVMAGGGIAVFYFTIAFAFHEYQLFSQTTAFVIMVVITAFGVTLALLYDKIELAVIAVVGGFLAPFLVSNGSNNYVALFSYLLILNTGMLIIAYFKKWPLLHVLSFFFTLLIFGGWLIQQLFINNVPALPYQNALFFATAFYLVFLTTVLIHNLRKEKPFKVFDFSLLIVITASYYAEGMVILRQWDHGAYQGIFNIVLGMINLVLAAYLYKKQKGDKNLLYLLIGLTITFISLASPVQLHGHSITLFWSAETVLLFWLHQRSKIDTFKYFSAIVLVAMWLSLMIDWSIASQKSNSALMLIFNNWHGIVTNIVAVISLGLYAWLLQKAPSDNYIFSIKNKVIVILMAVAATLILYATFIFGVNLFFAQAETYVIPNVYHQLITYLFIAGIIFVIQRLKIINGFFISIALILIAFLFYISSAGYTNNLLTGMIKSEQPVIHAMVHWLADACMLYLLYQLTNIFRKNFAVLGNAFAWLNNLLLLVFFSVECKYLYVSILAGPGSIDVVTGQYLKAGLTIVWALFSFVIMWLGMKYKYKTLRIISLSIFSAALLKLFLFDIIKISAGGKIAAFIMLGILLLVISFMYQRLKKIIIDDENKTT